MLKAKYGTYDEIPAEYRDLFEERGGVWILKRIDGLASDGDMERLNRSLSSARSEVTELKEKLKSFEGLDPVEVREKLDKYEELETLAAANKNNKIDDDTINDIVEKRIKSKLAPIERELEKTKTERDTALGEASELKGTITKGKIEREIRNAAAKTKMIPTAIEDAILYGSNILEVSEDGMIITRDNVGVTPGLGVEDLLNDMREKRPHWWPESVGGGAKGPGGSASMGGANPWTHAGWNMTEQGKIFRESPERAEKLARAAGTKVGGSKPAAK